MKNLTLKKAGLMFIVLGFLTLFVAFFYDPSCPPLQDPELAPKEVVAALDARSAKAEIIYLAGWVLVGIGGVLMLLNFGIRPSIKK